MHNLVRIMFKYRAENAFEYLAGHFLKLIDVCLNGQTSDTVSDIADDASYENYTQNQLKENRFFYDKDFIYLWLLFAKKHMDSFALEAANSQELRPEQSLFLDFIYVCLYNLTNLKQRNSILFQMSLHQESNISFQSANFNQVLIFICLKAYLNLHQTFSKNQMAIIESFVSEYVFVSSLILIDLNATNTVQLGDLFAGYLNNELLFKGSNHSATKSVIESMSKYFDEKINECKSLADAKEKVKLPNGAKFRINTLSQAFMFRFEQSVNFKSPKLDNIHSIQVAYFNLCIRVRHLLYLLSILNLKVYNFFQNAKRNVF